MPLLFEAAVMGGTPAVKMLREAMVGDDVKSVAGILNGTCNYILSEMDTGAAPFADVLAEAQRLGYAEADPTMDVGGFDAAHKISILAALAFGCAPNYAAAEIEGIDQVALLDIQLAKDLGYKIKLIASADRSATACWCACTRPWWPLEPSAGPGRRRAQRAVHRGHAHRPDLPAGPGRGLGPTAAAVAADIADVMTGGRAPGVPAPPARLAPFAAVDPAKTRRAGPICGSWSRTEPGRDRRGVGDAWPRPGVSIESFLQKPVDERRRRADRADDACGGGVRADGGDRPHRQPAGRASSGRACCASRAYGCPRRYIRAPCGELGRRRG